MNASKSLAEKGVGFVPVSSDDFPAFFSIKTECFKTYVDEYYGGWADDVQFEKTSALFAKAMQQYSFLKVLSHGEIVGFFTYHETAESIESITLQLTKSARNQGIGSYFLEQIVSLSNRTGKPAFLRVFKSNKARGLYERFGFHAYDETETHYLMRFDPNR